MSVRSRPLSDEQMEPSMLELFAKWRLDGQLFNFFRTLSNNPPLAKAWTVFGTYIFAHTGLTRRQSELLILRTTWLCGSQYEFAHHVQTASRSAVLDETDVRAVAIGPQDPHWSAFESRLLQAAGELDADADISDLTWQALSGELLLPQLMDIIYTCGAYRVGACATNCLRVSLDAGVPVPERLPPPRRERLAR